MAISQSNAQIVLASYVPTIQEIVDSAWNDYQTHYAHVSHLHSIRTKANIMRDHMVNHARRLFDGMSGARIIERAGLFLVEIQNTVILRFKKFNDDEQTSNYPTQQAIDYHEQQELPGMPSTATRLEAGWQPNSLYTSIRTLISCPRGLGMDPYWVWDLLIPATMDTSFIEPGTQLEIPEKRKRVRVKKTQVKKIKGAKNE